MNLVLRIVLSAVALLIVAALVPGIHADGYGSALIAAVLLALVNAVVRPVLILLTLPITLVTLGLFLLVINAGMLLFVGHVVAGFTVRGWGAGITGSLLMWVAGMGITRLIGDDRRAVEEQTVVVRRW
jgi:putative membrane protein